MGYISDLMPSDTQLRDANVGTGTGGRRNKEET